MEKYFIILSVFILLYAFPAFSRDWKKEDTQREIIWTAILFVDYGQTMNIAKNPDKYYEYNPILGKHPSPSSVDIYMLSAAILHPVISYYLPPNYRKWWQYITIGIEMGAITNNFIAGIGISF